MKKFTLMFALLFIANTFFSLTASAQLDLPEDKVHWEFTVEQNGDEATVIGKITSLEHWHINAVYLPEETFLSPTGMELNSSSNFKKAGKLTESKPIIEIDEILDEEMRYHEGTMYLRQKIKITSDKDFTITGVFSFQTCTDAGMCLPPFETDFSVKVKGVELKAEVEPKEIVEDTAEIETIIDTIVENTAETEVVQNKDNGDDAKDKGHQLKENKDEDENDVASMSLLSIFLLSFAAGFAALLTPCVFPMIPMTVSFFTKQSKSKAQGIRNAIIFGISIIVIYILLGTVVTGIYGADALNEMSTNFWFNIIFFVLLVVFAISFLGAFEIRLPSSWLNKADKASDKGGLVGIFFMALALALVSFSCTGPIVGTLLVQAATIGGSGPLIGMFGFSLALALPFALFAAFPGWMNSMPKSGGWLNTVKVVLGFLELALAFKFLSNADLVVQGHFLEREMFLAIWIGIFGILALYLFGKLTLPHDSPVERLSVGRTLFGTTVVIFVIYLIPGLWGAPLKIISGFPPPMSYSESPLGFGGGGMSASEGGSDMHLAEHGLMVFHDYDKGVAYAKEVGKPVLLDFTGYACVNCRRMEAKVWGDGSVLPIMKNDVVMISLYVDDNTVLPKDEQTDDVTTYGNKWSKFQAETYKINSQPYYRMLGSNGEDLDNGSADYMNHGNPEAFNVWLKEGLELYEKGK